MNVSDFKKVPKSWFLRQLLVLSNSCKKKKPKKPSAGVTAASFCFYTTHLFFLFLLLACSQWFEVGGALLDKGDVTYVAAPMRFKQLFNQSIVMFVVASRS